MDPISTGLGRPTFGGLVTGLDTGLLIESLMSLERRPVEILQERRDALAERQSLFRDFNSKLLALRDAARAIDNLSSTLSGSSIDEEFLSFSAASSDENVVKVTASGDATAGSYSVRVEQLAVVGRELSTTFAASDTVIASEGEVLSISFGTGDTRNFSVTVGAGGATLENLRDAINGDSGNGGNIQAEILYDGSQYRLIISGANTGANDDFSVSGTGATLGSPTFIDSSLSQDAADATLKVLGVTVTSATNTVTDALPGLTLELTGTNSATDTTDAETVTVTLDQEGVEEKLQALVDAYNEAATFISDQFSVNDVTEKAGPLANDSLLRSMQQTLQSLVTDVFSFTGNPYSSLVEIGVEFGSDGLLSIDSDQLGEVLAENPQAVRELLSGDGVTDGAATAIARRLEPIVRFGDGTLAVRDQSFDRQISDLEDQIGRFEARLVVREETLLARFSRLESMVSMLQTQSFLLGQMG